MDKTVAIIGLGYVGLPLAVAFGRAGVPVVGVDVSRSKVEEINAGRSYIPDVPAIDVAALVKQNRLRATTDYAVVGEAEAIFICVPTPYDLAKAPDLSFIISAAEGITPHLKPGHLVVLQSTTYPGTTDEIVLPILERSGLKLDADFDLAFSPERIDPGNTQFNAINTPKVVGGVNAQATQRAAALLKRIGAPVEIVSSARAAEMTKLLENIFRSVNIALVNEIALLCERMNMDVWEVIRAASTKPFGFMPFQPGAGVGGHCLDGNEWLFVKDGHGLHALRFGEYFDTLAAAYPQRVRVIGDVTLIEGIDAAVLSFDAKTQTGCFKPLQALSRRSYAGEMVEILTTDRRALRVTDGHPLMVHVAGQMKIKPAASLGAGDELILPTCFPEAVTDLTVDLIAHLDAAEIRRTRIRPQLVRFRDYGEQLQQPLKRLGADVHEIYRKNQMPLALYLELERQGHMPLARSETRLRTGRGPAAASHPAVVVVDMDFARLIGYYLSEGCITQDKSLRTRFTFNSGEHEYIDDVCAILTRLGLRYSLHKDKHFNALQIKVSSNLFARLLRDVLRCGTHSTEMQIPAMLLAGPASIRRAVLAGLLRGDGDVTLQQRTRHYYHEGHQREYDHAFNAAAVGYFSSSPALFQQTLLLAQSLGLVPTIKKDKPYWRLYGQEQLEFLTEFFDGAKRTQLERYAAGRRKTMPTTSFAAHEHFATIQVKETARQAGEHLVYSAEVADTHTFVTSFGIVTHNCIPIDPLYLSWKAREYDFHTNFIDLAAEVNESMPYHVVDLVIQGLSQRGCGIKDSRVLVLGVAFKRDIDDPRNSPAERVIELLLQRGAQVQYHDKYVAQYALGPDVFCREKTTLNSVALDEALTHCDCAVIVTGHRHVDYQQVIDRVPLVVDCCNVTGGLQDGAGRVVRLGVGNSGQ